MYTKKKVREREEIVMPPSRACGVCRNRMNDVCLNECAPVADFKDFDPDMRRVLVTFPKLTYQEYLELPASMKGKWLFVMQTKLVEAINGDDNLRPLTYRQRSCRIPTHQQEPGLLPGSSKGNTIYQAEPEKSGNQGNGSGEVDRE